MFSIRSYESLRGDKKWKLTLHEQMILDAIELGQIPPWPTSLPIGDKNIEARIQRNRDFVLQTWWHNLDFTGYVGPHTGKKEDLYTFLLRVEDASQSWIATYMLEHFRHTHDYGTAWAARQTFTGYVLEELATDNSTHGSKRIFPEDRLSYPLASLPPRTVLDLSLFIYETWGKQVEQTLGLNLRRIKNTGKKRRDSLSHYVLLCPPQFKPRIS